MSPIGPAAFSSRSEQCEFMSKDKLTDLSWLLARTSSAGLWASGHLPVWRCYTVYIGTSQTPSPAEPSVSSMPETDIEYGLAAVRQAVEDTTSPPSGDTRDQSHRTPTFPDSISPVLDPPAGSANGIVSEIAAEQPIPFEVNLFDTHPVSPADGPERALRPTTLTEPVDMTGYQTDGCSYETVFDGDAHEFDGDARESIDFGFDTHDPYDVTDVGSSSASEPPPSEASMDDVYPGADDDAVANPLQDARDGVCATYTYGIASNGATSPTPQSYDFSMGHDYGADDDFPLGIYRCLNTFTSEPHAGDLHAPYEYYSNGAGDVDPEGTTFPPAFEPDFSTAPGPLLPTGVDGHGDLGGYGTTSDVWQADSWAMADRGGPSADSNRENERHVSVPDLAPSLADSLHLTAHELSQPQHNQTTAVDLSILPPEADLSHSWVYSHSHCPTGDSSLTSLPPSHVSLESSLQGAVHPLVHLQFNGPQAGIPSDSHSPARATVHSSGCGIAEAGSSPLDRTSPATSAADTHTAPGNSYPTRDGGPMSASSGSGLPARVSGSAWSALEGALASPAPRISLAQTWTHSMPASVSHGSSSNSATGADSVADPAKECNGTRPSPRPRPDNYASYLSATSTSPFVHRTMGSRDGGEGDSSIDERNRQEVRRTMAAGMSSDYGVDGGLRGETSAEGIPRWPFAPGLRTPQRNAILQTPQRPRGA